jgi:transposase-like protein
MPALVNLPSLIDDARCFELVRQHRWPEGVRCPRCDSAEIVRDGRDEAQPHRQRYRCAACGSRFDDLTGTVLAGRHRPLRLWVLCLYLMGLNLSNERGSVRLLWREKRWGVWSTSEGRGRSVFGGPEPRLPTWPVGCCALASGDVP